MPDPGEYLPLLCVSLLAATTFVGIAGAWAAGRLRGMRDAAGNQLRESDTHARIERMEKSLEAVAEEIERL